MQNTSHAVMAQRTEAKDSLDNFPTPPWETRRLLEHVIATREIRAASKTPCPAGPSIRAVITPVRSASACAPVLVANGVTNAPRLGRRSFALPCVIKAAQGLRDQSGHRSWRSGSANLGHQFW